MRFRVDDEGGVGIRRWAKVNGKGSVELASKEGSGSAINETLNGMAEEPTEDGVDRDFVTKGNGEVNWGAIQKGVWENVGDNGLEEAVKVIGVKRSRVTDCTCKANWFERLRWVIKVNEGVGVQQQCDSGMSGGYH